MSRNATNSAVLCLDVFLRSEDRRFISLPDGGAEALAPWVVFTYALDAFDVATILALCSPLKRCGKTTTEELTAALVKRPLAAANLTVAALYPHRGALRAHADRG